VSRLLEHLPSRLAGLFLLLVAMLAYEPDAGGLLHRILIPVAMAAAAAMMVQSLAAVALGAGLLAAIHSDAGSPDWVTGRAYPALALASATVLVTILGRRFRRRIVETREARWAPRRRAVVDSPPGDTKP